MTGSDPAPRIALVIFRLAPAGGLEQHCLRLLCNLAKHPGALRRVHHYGLISHAL